VAELIYKLFQAIQNGLMLVIEPAENGLELVAVQFFIEPKLRVAHVAQEGDYALIYEIQLE